MKLNFDSNQAYQNDAIKSITDIFEGQPLSNSDFGFTIDNEGVLLTENGFGNNLKLSEEQVFENVKTIQDRNKIATSLFDDTGFNFSIEMETGMGKTYVYLRTIYELNKLYGFKKFVIVVPSVAIREGVIQNLKATHEHFQNLCNKTAINYEVYDSKKVSGLRGFASSNNIQILVMNIQAFNSSERIINKLNDKLIGKKPIEFIQSTNPIVIVDEPQNMEAEAGKKAIENLMPLCTLRYSATHTNTYNLKYSLNPVNAYDLGLVKHIEVDSIMRENDFNSSYIQLENVNRIGINITAKIKIDVVATKGIDRKSVSAKGSKLDLFLLSNKNGKYDGLKIEKIDFGEKQITLNNGVVLGVGESQGGMNDEVMRYMIEKTVQEHLAKEKKYKPLSIKVLSLFFIDKVKNYKDYDEAGNSSKGKFALWFEEIFNAEIQRKEYQNLISFSADEVHNGYFSADKKGRFRDTDGESQVDDSTYKLIMQEREKLLEMNVPLRFIFSHSALREGWDNPNVFQICTLNETKSVIKKRQEIGRGLRLSVNQNGERIFDANINKLTVVANERYEDFAKQLQHEIEQECGVSFSGKIKNKNSRVKINYRKGFEMDEKFLQIWNKINFTQNTV